MQPFARLSLAALVAVALPAVVSAHFVLVQPAPTLQQDRLGNPQKLGPCGGTSADAGTPSGAVTPVQGGTTLHIEVQETVFHPGHYRVALAVNALSELPAEPDVTTEATANGPRSVSAVIDQDPKPPVLADGVFVHTDRAAIAAPFEADVSVPNITCPRCTLQVIEFMAQHGYNADGGYFYHHCAALAITADPSKPIDTRWPSAR